MAATAALLALSATAATSARDSAFYVSNFGTFPGSDPSHALPGTGQVVRIRP